MNTINLGFTSFTVWPVVLLIGIIIGAIVTLIMANKHKKGGVSALFLFLISGLVAGRLVFVVQHMDDFDGIWQMLDFTDGGISYTASLIASLVVFALLQTQAKQRRSLNYGVLTMLGVYGTFTFLIAVASSHAVLPNDAFIDANGKTVKIIDVSQQRPVVVNLWATPCEPCKRELPLLEQAAAKHQNIAFIYLNQAESQERVSRFLQSTNIKHQTVLIDSRGITAENKGIFTFPVTLFFDTQGQLIYSHNGELDAQSLNQGIDAVL